MSAESAEHYTPPLDWAIAFDIATGTNALAEFHARKVGAKLIYGREALDAKLGQLLRSREDMDKKIKAVKKAMGEEV